MHQSEDLCVARVPLFQGLSDDEQQQVAGLARPVRIAAGQQVSGPGTDTAQLMVVHTGSIKVSRIDAEGREQILRIVRPGDFLGESAFLTGHAPEHFATSLDAGSMCVFRHRDLAGLMRDFPSIGFRMLRTVSRRLADTERRLASVISGDVGSRLAGYLLALPVISTGDRMAVKLPLPKKDIASLLDTTPESLSRQLRRLQDSGVIVVDQELIRLLDPDALTELAATG